MPDHQASDLEAPDPRDTSSDSMETESHAIARLQAHGYVHDFSIAEDGSLSEGESAYDIDDLMVDEILRFEGASNPDDESMLLAARVGSAKGTLSLPYGPDISGPQADAVRGLMTRHRRH